MCVGVFLAACKFMEKENEGVKVSIKDTRTMSNMLDGAFCENS